MRIERLAGDQLEALADAILNKVKNSERYGKNREQDYVFQEDRLTLENLAGVLERLGERTPMNVEWDADGNIADFSGGNVIRNKWGGINLDNVPRPRGKDYVKYNNEEIDSSQSQVVEAQVYPERFPDATGQIGYARDLGIAMRDNDYDAYRALNNQMEVDDDVIPVLLKGGFSKGKADGTLGGNNFKKAGGIGTPARSQVLMPGTDRRFIDEDSDTQKAYLNERSGNFLRQWLQQRGGSMGSAQSVIFTPGLASHMDHVQSLSSSRDTLGDAGWGWSDEVSNYSYLDEDFNTQTKLNYDLAGTHKLMRLADTMNQMGHGAHRPRKLTQKELGDPERKRLSTDEATTALLAKTINPKTANRKDIEDAIDIFRTELI